MGRAEAVRLLTEVEYLELEATARVRHEYVRGQVFAMTGASDAHNVISGNLFAALHAFVKGSDCRVYINDMKVRIKVAESYYYPDVMVSCEPFVAESVYKTAPRLIIEVLSPSTRQIDRREKLVAYRQLNSLEQYLIVHQKKLLLELYSRDSEGKWQRTMLGDCDSVELAALPDKALSLPASAVYEGVELTPRVEESEEEYEFA